MDRDSSNITKQCQYVWSVLGFYFSLFLPLLLYVCVCVYFFLACDEFHEPDCYFYSFNSFFALMRLKLRSKDYLCWLKIKYTAIFIFIYSLYVFRWMVSKQFGVSATFITVCLLHFTQLSQWRWLNCCVTHSK